MANKKRYRVRNWAQYNKSLINRGSITIWFDEEVIAKWHATKRNGNSAAIEVGAKPCFPPRENAVRHLATDEAWRLHNYAVSEVHYKGKKKWKLKHSYHRRSLSETAFFRLKKLFGSHVSSKLFNSQAMELGLRCHILNRMNALGMPDSVKI